MVISYKKPTPRPEASSGTSFSVVLIEDQISMRKAMSRIIESAGCYSIKEFSTAPEAIAYISKTSVDIIVSDIYLSKGTGIEVLQSVRSQAMGSDLPVLFVTGEATKDDIVLAVDLGVNDYLIKPFDASDLLSKMKKLIDTAHAKNERWEKVKDAERLFFRKKYLEASTVFSALLEEEPNSVRIMVSLAHTLCQLGKANQAMQIAQSAIEQSPMYFPAYSIVTNILLKRGKKTEAIDMLEKELAIHGKQVHKRILLTDLLVEAGDKTAAYQNLRQALLDFPRDEFALLRMAYLRYEMGDVEKCLHYYLKLRRLNANSTKALDGIVNICYKIGNTKRGFQILTDLTKTNPQAKDVYLARAKLHEKLKEDDQALGELEVYLTSVSSDVEALLLKGKILLRTGKAKSAMECFGAAEKIDSSAQTLGAIGFLCLKQRKFDAARTYLQKSLAWQPKNVKLLKGLALTLENLKQFVSSGDTYNSILALNPNDEEARVGLKRVASKITAKAS